MNIQKDGLQGQEIRSPPHRVQTSLGPTHSRIKCVSGVSSLGVKRTRREVDHPRSSSAEIKNAWRGA
jgi:hypothetical protein